MKGRGRRLLAIGAVVTVLAVGWLAFSYFVSPLLVIAGLHDNGQFGMQRGAAYQLGGAQWSAGTVTYPFTSGGCHGTITLRWQGVFGGWQPSNWNWTCAFGHTGISAAG